MVTPAYRLYRFHAHDWRLEKWDGVKYSPLAPVTEKMTTRREALERMRADIEGRRPHWDKLPQQEPLRVLEYDERGRRYRGEGSFDYWLQLATKAVASVDA